MEFTAGQIAEFIKGTVDGNAEAKVNTVSKIEEGFPGSLSFLSNPKYTKYIYNTKASIVIVNEDFVPEKSISATLIRVKDAYAGFASLLEVYRQYKDAKSGVSKSAIIEESASLGEDLYIGANVYIGHKSVIEAGCKIYPNSYIGDNVKIGKGTVLFAGVSVYADSIIGNSCIIHAGTVIGSDGFGFAPQNQKEYKKIPQIGNVVVEDNVEIGANTTVDKATFGSTIIRKGVKLDNLIQIAHNVEVGENTVIASQTGISGSTKIGKNCMIGGQVGFAGHLTIGDNVKIGAQSGVHKNLPDNSVVQGSPVVPYREWYRTASVLQKLPEMYRKIQNL